MENYIIYYLLLLLFPGLLTFIIPLKYSKILTRFTLLGSIYFPAMMIYNNVPEVNTYNFGNFDYISGIELKFEKLHLIFLIINSIVAFVASFFAKNSSEIILTNIASFGFMGLLLTNDLFNAYVFIEVASISCYGLAYNRKNDISSLYALQYLFIATVSACVFLLGIGFMYAATGSLNIYKIAELTSTAQNSMTMTSAILIIMSLCFKAGSYPVFLFYKKVYRNTSTASMLYLSSIPSITYILFLSKLFSYLFITNAYDAKLLDEGVIIYLSVSALITAFVALDSDRLIDTLISSGFVTYSYLMIIATKGNSNILAPVIILDMLVKAPFILFAKKIDQFVGSDPENYIIKDKFSKFIIILFSLSILGLPLSLGFYSKVFVIPTLLSENLIVTALYLITSVMIFRGISKHLVSLFRPKHLAPNIMIRYSGFEKAAWSFYSLAMLGAIIALVNIMMRS